MEGRPSRGLSGAMVFCAALLAATVAAIAAPAQQNGTFALLNGTSKIVSKFWAVPGRNALTVNLHVRQFQPNSSEAIMQYDEEMESTIHMVVIRDDFATFDHLHPAFNTTTGTFTQNFTREPNHRYYVYADTVPHGIGQQVFRYTIEADGALGATAPALEVSDPTAVVGPYSVVLEKTSFPANTPLSIDLTVNKGTKPANDLGVYLGAPAHCVFIDTSTLQYVHVHPALRNQMSNGTMQMNLAGPLMRLHVPALPAGTYKMWVQFRGAAYKLYAAPFTIAVR